MSSLSSPTLISFQQNGFCRRGSGADQSCSSSNCRLCPQNWGHHNGDDADDDVDVDADDAEGADDDVADANGADANNVEDAKDDSDDNGHDDKEEDGDDMSKF